MTENTLSAIYCPQERHLMTESGKVYIVPEQVARSFTSTNDLSFVRAWAALNSLIPSHGEVGYFEEAV